MLLVPELREAEAVVFAEKGFNVIATANIRDRGVHEMSSALKRRFNFETVNPIADPELELRLVMQQTESLLAEAEAEVVVPIDVIDLLVTTFHDLRAGRTQEGMTVERPSTVMSTAEAVSVGVSAGLDACYFGGGRVEQRARRPQPRRHGAQGQPRRRQAAQALLRRRGQSQGAAERKLEGLLQGQEVVAVSEAGRDARAELDGFLRALGASAVRFFPVRHHSPACAWHVRELIRRERPRAVLIEGPADITPLIPFILSPETRAPFAVYTTYVNARARNAPAPEATPDAKPARSSGYYPFCDYSPELVALRAGPRSARGSAS